MPDELHITITVTSDGKLLAHESREGSKDEWRGVMLLLGDAFAQKFAHFSWGEYESIVYAMYAAIMDARRDDSTRGHHHRAILGKICRMIMELYGFFQRYGDLPLSEAIRKMEEEDRGEGEPTEH